jgi:hypothetical protein
MMRAGPPERVDDGPAREAGPYSETVDPPAATPLAEVRVFLRAASTRGFDDATRIDIGRVRFGGWQIHAVPADRYTQDAYLVRANVDLAVEPGAGGPRCAEAGFAFDTPGVSVLDAVPQSVHVDEPPRTYRLSPLLNFVAAGPDADTEWLVPLGAQQPVTEALGVGGPWPRWRWTAMDSAGVRPGTRTGWFVLLVPPGTRRIRIRPTAAYLTSETDTYGWEPGCEAVDLEITLPEPSAPGTANSATPFSATLAGSVRLQVIRRLDGSWADLADYLEVPVHEQARFPRGDEPRALLQWLDGRGRLHELPAALRVIGRADLADLLHE